MKNRFRDDKTPIRLKFLDRMESRQAKQSGAWKWGAPARVVAELSTRALLGNYHAIRAQVPDQAILPMIKADAYGHGADWVARLLHGLPALHGYGVATLGEAVRLRESLGPRYRRSRIIVFSGATPWTEEKGELCESYNLTPVIATDADWSKFVKAGWPARVPYELKFNTGMNRLGISMGVVSAVAKALRLLPAESHPAGILSHLAMAEEPDHKLSLAQLEKFSAIRAELSIAAPGARFHLANSAGIWNQKHWRLRELTDVVRPGLSLYGVPPWPGAPERSIVPVMCLKASVLTVHRLKAGQSVGYGATFQVKGEGLTHSAVLGAGYADGISRALSNQGYAWLGGKVSRFLGTVSMDLCAVSCSAETQVGEWAEILGPRVDSWAQAKAAQTIPYELLTSVSNRVERVHVD